LIEIHFRHAPTKVSKSKIKRLLGLRHPRYRLRIDDTRVFYDVTKTSVEILAIIPKSKASQWLKEAGDKTRKRQPYRTSRTISPDFCGWRRRKK